jgi:hypothetical protein
MLLSEPEFAEFWEFTEFAVRKALCNGGASIFYISHEICIYGE